MIKHVQKNPMELARDEAVAAAGGPGPLARYLGISRQAVLQWRQVAYDKVLAVEALTGISRHRLRPDLYGPPPASAPPQSGAPPRSQQQEGVAA